MVGRAFVFDYMYHLCFCLQEFGWLDRPFASAEENCLAWGITFTRRSPRMSEGWHSDSCCNNLKFICQV